MAVIFDTPVLRPDIGVQARYSAVATYVSTPFVARRAAVVSDLPKRRRASMLEARWTLDRDGRLICDWHAVFAA